MPPGASRRVRPRAVRPERPACGGSTFAENPSIWAPAARIIWHADLDPGTLSVTIRPTSSADPDGVDRSALTRWLTIADDEDGREHAVLSNGWKRIRLDVEHGTLRDNRPILVHYRLKGIPSAASKILPLRRFIALCRRGSFAPSLFPRDPRLDRWLLALRVYDALRAGARQQDIVDVLFAAPARTALHDSLKARVRRLVAQARALARGRYRSILSGAPPRR